MRTGGWGKYNSDFACGAFRKAKYEIRRRRKNRNRKARAGKNSFPPPDPRPFCPPERSVFCSAFGGAISQSFVQKRFELRSVIATSSDILKNQRRLFACSPRLRRVSLRKKPCISELNRKVGQIQIRLLGKQMAVRRAKHAIPQMRDFQFFPFRQRRNTKQVF